MNIEAKCKNCRFCKEMAGPYDTDNYYICMYGSLVLTVEPEKKCAHVIESFEPTESLLREYWRSQQRFTPSDYINKDETSEDWVRRNNPQYKCMDDQEIRNMLT